METPFASLWQQEPGLSGEHIDLCIMNTGQSSSTASTPPMSFSSTSTPETSSDQIFDCTSHGAGQGFPLCSNPTNLSEETRESLHETVVPAEDSTLVLEKAQDRSYDADDNAMSTSPSVEDNHPPLRSSSQLGWSVVSTSKCHLGDEDQRPVSLYGACPRQAASNLEFGDGKDLLSNQLIGPIPEENVDKIPYAQLIYNALLEAQDHRLPLRDIYRWIETHTERVKDTSFKGWQNSVRHNLSMNGAFTKLACPHSASKSRTSFVWVLEKSAKERGIQPTTRYRQKPIVGRPARSTRSPALSSRNGYKKEVQDQLSLKSEDLALQERETKVNEPSPFQTTDQADCHNETNQFRLVHSQVALTDRSLPRSTSVPAPTIEICGRPIHSKEESLGGLTAFY